MQKFSSFSKNEWLKLLPLQYAFKQVRNDLALGAYVKRTPEHLPAFLRENSHLRDKDIVLIVAFEQSQVLELVLSKARSYLPDAHLLVFDNSRNAAARMEIERTCRDHKISYLALPPNSVRHANRSHGMAMTWIFRNVVRAIKPRIFAFIDHDLIPFKPVDLGKALAGQPFYGSVRTHRCVDPRQIGDRSWSLWAGYCLYDFSAVKDLPLNFLYDFSRGLDTGGRNWDCLYKNYDHRKLRFADSPMVPLSDSSTGIVYTVQIVDGRWLHFQGASYREGLEQKTELYTRLANTLSDADAQSHS